MHLCPPKFVSQATHCCEVDRVRRVILNLPSQRQDMKVHRAGIKGVIVAPHLLQKTVPAEHLSPCLTRKRRGWNSMGVNLRIVSLRQTWWLRTSMIRLAIPTGWGTVSCLASSSCFMISARRSIARIRASNSLRLHGLII